MSDVTITMSETQADQLHGCLVAHADAISLAMNIAISAGRHADAAQYALDLRVANDLLDRVSIELFAPDFGGEC